MKNASTWSLIGLGLLCASLCFAQQPPPGAPAGTTGLCKDGSYWSGATKRGACRGHKGVKEWYGAARGSASETPAPAAGAAPAPPSEATAPSVAPRSAPKRSKAPPAPSANAAAGGGPGLVWVNHKSKVYHCAGDRWYGKTKDGEYMSEGDATAKGYRPDHGKACK